MDEDRERQLLIEEIRNYLTDHPEAKDSFEGILWWLTRQRYERIRPLIHSVLDQLVAEGVLERSSSAGGQPLYSLRREDE